MGQTITCIRTNGKFIIITVSDYNVKVYFGVRLSTGRGYNNCINFSNIKSPQGYMLCARVCLCEEREKANEKETRGGRKAKKLPSKVCRKWMLGRKRQYGDLRQQRVSRCVILFGAASSDSHPALNPQHKSAVRPPGPARGSPQDTQRLRNMWISHARLNV